MQTKKQELSHYLKNPFLSGTIILTLAGFLTKIIGFFYKIFLARIFHDEGLGIIGLISPIMMLVHSLCASGIQNAITKYVAACGKSKKAHGYGYLYTGILFSLSLSSIMAFLIFQYSSFICTYFLHEQRCTSLLKITALSFPLASLHTCLNGFFYAEKKAGIPAASLLAEQGGRVLSVFLLYSISLKQQTELPLITSAIGLFVGECASAIFSCCILLIHTGKGSHTSKKSLISLQKCKDIFALAAPLSLNRILISVLSSFETIQLPLMLVKSGLTTNQALSVYGVFSGMAFPLIMFPCALTGSAGSLMLPYISEQQANKNYKRIHQATLLTLIICFLVGFAFMLFLLTFADIIGHLLFQSDAAGKQIRALAFSCPFLYLSGMLNNILHGLGKTTITFLFSMISLGCRLFFVFFAVPALGFTGYFYGILCSQILLDLLLILALKRYIIYN